MPETLPAPLPLPLAYQTVTIELAGTAALASPAERSLLQRAKAERRPDLRLQTLLRAAEHALDTGLTREARSFLALAEKLPCSSRQLRGRCHLQLLLAECALDETRLVAARRLLDQAVCHGSRETWPEHFWTHTLLSGTLARLEGRLSEALSLLGRAARGLQGVPGRRRLLVLEECTLLQTALGDTHRATAFGTRLVAGATATRSQAALARAHATLAHCHILCGDQRGVLRHERRARPLAEAHLSPFLQARLLRDVARAYIWSHDWEGASSTIRLLTERASVTEEAIFAATGALTRAEFSLERRRFKRVLAETATLRAMAVAATPRGLRYDGAVVEADALLALGRGGKASETLSDCIVASPHVPFGSYNAPLRLAVLHARNGNLDGARRWWRATDQRRLLGVEQTAAHHLTTALGRESSRRDRPAATGGVERLGPAAHGTAVRLSPRKAPTVVVYEPGMTRPCEEEDLPALTERPVSFTCDLVRGFVEAVGHGPLRISPGTNGARILATLMTRGARPISRKELFRAVWGAPFNPLYHDNNVYVAIHGLRRKLGRLNCIVACGNCDYRFEWPGTWRLIVPVSYDL